MTLFCTPNPNVLLFMQHHAQARVEAQRSHRGDPHSGYNAGIVAHIVAPSCESVSGDRTMPTRTKTPSYLLAVPVFDLERVSSFTSRVKALRLHVSYCGLGTNHSTALLLIVLRTKISTACLGRSTVTQTQPRLYLR